MKKLLILFLLVISPKIFSQSEIEVLNNKVERLERRIETLESFIIVGEDSVKKVYQEKWKNIELWRQLKSKMSPEEVRGILGEPTRIKIDNSEEFWRYGRFREINGKVTFNYSTQQLKSWNSP